jgi:DNA-binding transcriptional MerR regulator
MFQIGKVEKITGLTRRQLQYWCNTSLIEPEACSDEERKPNLWSFQSLVALRSIRKLLDQKVSLQKIRKALDYARMSWPDLENHLTELTFYVINNGKEVLLFGPEDSFPVSALRAQGQTVFVLPGSDIASEVAAAVERLYDKPLTLKEAEESSKAWSDYLAGKDPGKTLDDVRQEILAKQEENLA